MGHGRTQHACAAVKKSLLDTDELSAAEPQPKKVPQVPQVRSSALSKKIKRLSDLDHRTLNKN